MALPILVLALGALKIGMPADATNETESFLSESEEPSGLTPSNDPWSKDYVDRSPVIYENCDAARRAGAAPIYARQRGYSTRMDGDLDGIACEPYRRR